MITLIISCLVAIAGAANGIMDTLQFHYTKSRYAKLNPDFWNPAISWKRKYKRNSDGSLVQPLVPAYIGSTTWLVWTTDAWHLFKWLYQNSMRGAVVLPWIRVFGIWTILMFVGLFLLQSLMFHLTYKSHGKAEEN